MTERETYWDQWYKTYDDAWLVITTRDECIINFITPWFHQFRWKSIKTLAEKKEILEKKYEEIHNLLNSFEL